MIGFIILYFFLSLSNLALPKDEKNALIFQNIITFIKTLCGIIVIFIVGTFCIYENDQYSILLITGKTTKFKFYLSKFIFLTFIIIVYITLIVLSINVTGIIFSKDFKWQHHYTLLSFYMLLLILVYVAITQILVKLFNTNFSIIIGVILYFISDIFKDNSFLNLVFPTIDTDLSLILDFNKVLPMLMILLAYKVFNLILYVEKR